MHYAISILPYEGTGRASLEHLVQDLAATGITATLLPEAAIPPRAYTPARRQYDAHLMLRHAREQATTRAILGVTECDLYVEGLNFVFGLAESPGKAAVISLHHLAPGVDEHTFRERVLKEAVHELGHTLGLSHCPDPTCVMHFSNSLDDTDRKGKTYCAACQEKLRPFV